MNIFTYGTLMLPSVMRKVVGKDFASRRAVLKGYARFQVKGVTYPGIIPREAATTDGVLYLDVDDSSVGTLDEFEGDLYERVVVEVETEDGDALPACTYVVRPERADCLSARSWDLAEFRQNGLDEFLSTYEGFDAIREE